VDFVVMCSQTIDGACLGGDAPQPGVQETT
jgi:hypothetical protein